MNKPLLLFLLSAAAWAQGPYLSLSAGFALPTGDFAGQRQKADVGFAKIGFTGGAEFDLMTGLDGLAWSSALFYLANDYESNTFTQGLEMDLYESGAYGTISAMTGLKWYKPLGESATLFLLSRIGLASVKGPFLSGIPTASTSYEIVEFQMNRSNGFAYAFGLGMVFNQRTYLGLQWLNAGRAGFSKTVSYTLGNNRRTAQVGWETPVNLLLVTVGYSIDFSE
ncbi:MAG: hypothetical protein ONB24_13595 [candidate division KSB1 bacterium]|nr:hypothetical protein [candidate division KSB1 bacterium]